MSYHPTASKKNSSLPPSSGIARAKPTTSTKQTKESTKNNTADNSSSAFASSSRKSTNHTNNNTTSKPTNTQNKPPKWKVSEGKKYLEKELEDANSHFHQMRIEDIHRSDSRFSDYPLKNFKTNFKSLKKRIDATKERVQFDNLAVAEHLANYNRPQLTHGGYPHWNAHQAKQLLEKHVRDGTANRMAPRELRGMAGAYKDFPADVFAKRVHSEKQKQKGDAFWVEKRNRKGMKQRLTEVNECDKQV